MRSPTVLWQAKRCFFNWLSRLCSGYAEAANQHRSRLRNFAQIDCPFLPRDIFCLHYEGFWLNSPLPRTQPE